MGIAILIIFSIGLYQVGKWVVLAFLKKRNVAAATEVCVASVTQQVQPSRVESWASYETPTFLRRGMPYPVLAKKEKAKRRARKPKQLKAAPAPTEESFPMGDWTLFATEGENHVTAH